MGEVGKKRTVAVSEVVDDGWHLPKEVIHEIEFRYDRARNWEYAEVCRQRKLHRGDWLTDQVAKQYAARAWVWRVLNDNQYIGKVREIGEELQARYGVTELEAINILFERNVSDYVNKYDRIKNLIPRRVGMEEIREEVIAEYCAAG